MDFTLHGSLLTTLTADQVQTASANGLQLWSGNVIRFQLFR